MNIPQLCKCWAEVLARHTNSIYDLKLTRPFDSFETKQWLSSLCLFPQVKKKNLMKRDSCCFIDYFTLLFFYHFENLLF